MTHRASARGASEARSARATTASAATRALAASAGIVDVRFRGDSTVKDFSARLPARLPRLQIEPPGYPAQDQARARGECRMSVAVQEHPVVKNVEKRLLIGGEWRDASGGAKLAVEDPA